MWLSRDDRGFLQSHFETLRPGRSAAAVSTLHEGCIHDVVPFEIGVK